MQQETFLKAAVWPSLEKYHFLVSAAGIRYGSVAYVAFGNVTHTAHRGRATTSQYPVELDIGSDHWQLTQNGKQLISSDFGNVDRAREQLQALLAGKKVIDVELDDKESAIVFDHGMRLLSKTGSTPASGFLYSFQADKDASWETIDGFNLDA